MSLKPFFEGSWWWEILFPLADKGDLCRGRVGLCPVPATAQAGADVPGPRVGSWDRGGMQGKAGSKDALAGLSPGHPPPAPPCTAPLPPLPCQASPSKIPQISPNLHLLTPAWVWAPLCYWHSYLEGGLQTHGRALGQGRDVGWPWGHGPSPSAGGDNRAALGLPTNLLRCLSQHQAATTSLAAAFVYGLYLY